MPNRLVNQPIDRQTALDQRVAWTNCFNPCETFYVQKDVSPDLSKCLRYLASQLDVPQRSISALSVGSFYVHHFKGQHRPGCYPVNSHFWTTHCNVCDDLVPDSPLDRPRLCDDCGKYLCRHCQIDKYCIECALFDYGCKPQTHREILIQEAHDRTWSDDYQSNGLGQPLNHDRFDFFPFIEASFVDQTNLSSCDVCQHET